MPPALARNLRGRLVIRQTPHGLVGLSWPRKSRNPPTPAAIWWRATFGTAAQMSARPNPFDQAFAEAWAPNSRYVPRDFLTQAALGLLFEFTGPVGEQFKSIIAMGGNPQATLDLISNVPGSLLWRSPNGWVAIPPGLPGQSLMLDVVLGPVWRPAPGTPAALAFNGTRLHFTANKAGFNLSTNPVIAWDAAQYDTAGRFDPAQPQQITFGSADAGRTAQVSAAVQAASWNGSARGLLRVVHRDSAGTSKFTDALDVQPGNSSVMSLVMSYQSAIIAEGDYIQLDVYTNDSSVEMRAAACHLAATVSAPFA